MDDLISRQDAIDALEREKTYCTAYKGGYTQTDVFKQYNMGLTDGIKALNKLPSAQTEIIRCKDCKHNQVWTWNHGIRDNPRCNFTNYVRSNEFFCGFGERRSE